jgi:hypothetical protein
MRALGTSLALLHSLLLMVMLLVCAVMAVRGHRTRAEWLLIGLCFAVQFTKGVSGSLLSRKRRQFSGGK